MIRGFVLVVLSILVVVTGVQAASLSEKDAFAAVQASEEKLLAKADDTQKDQFQKIFASHATLRGVEDVRASLARAVASCIQENPDLKADFEPSFKAWVRAVDPTVEKGRRHVRGMINTQKIAPPDAIRAHLKAFDTYIQAASSAKHEVPIKDKKGCQIMRENMDQSAKTMAGMINETLGLAGEKDPPKQTPSTPKE